MAKTDDTLDRIKRKWMDHLLTLCPELASEQHLIGAVMGTAMADYYYARLEADSNVGEAETSPK